MLNISQASLRYDNTFIFKNLHFSLLSGKWNCILGATGCGKSSLLKLLAGILPDSAKSGYVSNLPDLQKQIAYMAQTDSLLPWLTVLDNVLLSFKLTGIGVNQALQERALALLAKVGLSDYAHFLPKSLSGGMKQKVALVRTFLQDQPIIFIDEPFAAFDVATRIEMQNLAFTLFANKTVLLITHDPLEALRLSSNLLLLQKTAVETIPLPDTKPLRQLANQDLARYQNLIIRKMQETKIAN